MENQSCILCGTTNGKKSYIFMLKMFPSLADDHELSFLKLQCIIISKGSVYMAYIGSLFCLKAATYLYVGGVL